MIGEISRRHHEQSRGWVVVAGASARHGLIVGVDDGGIVRPAGVESVGTRQGRMREGGLAVLGGHLGGQRTQHEPPRRQAVVTPPARRDETLVRGSTDPVRHPVPERVGVWRRPPVVVFEPVVRIANRLGGIPDHAPMMTGPRVQAEHVCRLVRARETLRMDAPSEPNRVRETRITPELSVRRGRAAVEFYKAAFGAVEDYRVGGTDENEAVVAQLSIGGATFWVADESPPHGTFSPESLGGGTVRVLLIVDDPESTLARAVAAGATEISPVHEEHRWRLGRIADPFGHHWEIGTPLVDWPHA
jgi:PhnB protein